MRLAGSSIEESANLLGDTSSHDEPFYRPEYPVSAGIFESLFFTWVNPLIGLGNSKILEKVDLLRIPDYIRSREVFKSLLKCLKFESLKRDIDIAGYELSASDSGKLPVKLWKALHTMIFRRLWFAGLCRFWSDAAVVLGSYFVQRIIAAAQQQNMLWIFIYATLILINSTIQTVLLQQFIHESFMVGSRVVMATTALAYHSSLSLRMHKMNPPKSLGEINNIQAKDSSSLREFVVFFHNLWACPLMIVACTAYLLFLLGWAGVVCCILLPMLIPLESYIAKQARIIRKDVLQKSDQRMTSINELIDGIWTVKLTGLCPYLYDKITRFRSDELAIGWQGTMIEMINIVITKSSTVVITLITFTIYCLVHPSTSLTADRVFTSLSLINIINRPLQVIPKCISMLSDAIVSCDRIETLLVTALSFNPRLLDDERHSRMPASAISLLKSPRPLSIEPQIIVDKVTAYRYSNDTSSAVLESISFTHQGTGLVLVTGSNGSGKSSFLLMILNELYLDHHSIVRIDSGGIGVAYCGHESWILNKTAKENIMSAYPSNKTHTANHDEEERYQTAVKACALETDFSSWTSGPDTLIGERGINISGGQKQRLAIARALMSSCKILLLDAIVSGLDVRVAHEIMTSIIKESRNRLIILSTSQLDWLQYATRIIHLSKGQVAFDGSYSDYQQLYASNGGVSAPNKTSTPKPVDLIEVHPEPVAGTVLHEIELDDKKAEKKGKAAKSVADKSIDVVAESRSMKVYLDYLYACGVQNICLALMLTLAAYGIGAFADVQTARWTDGSYSNTQYLLIYAVLSIAVILANFGRYFVYGYSGLVASKHLHSKLLQSIIGATFSFFQRVPSGRITSRFSVDFDTIDYSIPSSIASVVDAMLGIVTGVGVVIVTSPVYVVFIIPLSLLYYRFQARYRSVSKVLKKLDSASKSPIFSQFRETLSGLECIRGYRIEQKMIEDHYRLLDDSIEARLNWDAANRWLGIRLDMIGSLIVSAAAFSLLLSSNSSGGSAGLMLIYALKATQSLSFAIRASTALENMFTSPERVIEYIHIDQETSPSETALHGRVPHQELAVVNRVQNSILDANNVPVMSGLNVVAQYEEHSEQVLKGIDFDVHAGRLVGVCGRTGCGKSTLSVLLSRGLVHYTGRLLYMSRDVTSISLAAYRSAVISVYPQDSYIFSGSIRDFLDPMRIFDDLKLNYILNELIHAMNIDMILPNAREGVAERSGSRLSLDTIAAAGGNNLSAGQKQVVVFARAALATTKVVVLDEITSNMDPNAAKRAVEIVKEELTKRGVAVIIIAHNLNDIRLCDEVWVMFNGKIIEAGKPTELINRSNGEFAKMWSVHMQTESPSIHL
jgi:ATP-binding cassette, subfamily C (CFTR/MRP), member 1